MHKQYSITPSMPGYLTSGWTPVVHVQEIDHSSSISTDQWLASCVWTDKTRYRTVQSVLGLGRVMQWIHGLGAHRMTGIPFLAGVATFIFSTAPRETLGLIQHPGIVYDCMVLYVHSLICSRAWSLMQHKDKFTFTPCKYRWHYIPHLTCRMQKKCHTQWIHTNIWNGNNHIISMTWSLMQHKDKFTFTPCKYRWHYIPHLTCRMQKNVIHNESIPTYEKEITTSFPWLGVHILKCSPIRQHRIKKAQIIPERSNTSSKWHILKRAHLLRVDPVHTFCYYTMSTKITINDTTFISEII